MAKPDKSNHPKARLPRGLRDADAGSLRASEAMLATIREVFERYGFEPVETPLIEYTEALGKFLPDQERPGEGVFSFLDDDEQWLSLRYDLTAPLARYVAENFERLPKPYRSYRLGHVFRNEKPGPGRYRQFMQFDADTVGAPSVAADAEMCMLMADTLEALGIERGDYVIRVNNRKVLDGVMEGIGIGGPEDASKRLGVMRSLDKFDKFGIEGVVQLLSVKGRIDESGDHTKGVGLDDIQISRLLNTLGWGEPGSGASSAVSDGLTVSNLIERLEDLSVSTRGATELRELRELVSAAGYHEDRILVDPSVVRGLEYYTGPVYEAELLFETVNEKGEKARFGSVAGGGRYDRLVARFRGEAVPATGFSIGVSRLLAALTALGRVETAPAPGPVVVLIDKDEASIPKAQALVATLRAANVRAEMYLGAARGFGPQMKYADRRGSPCVVIQGPDERARGVVQVKDLIEGAKLSREIESRDEWREARPAQEEVAEAELVATVKRVLARHGLA